MRRCLLPIIAMLLACTSAKAQTGTPGATYSVETSVTNPAYTTPQDIACITGGPNKLVRVLHVIVRAEATAAAVENILLIKRTTLNTGGAPATATASSYDSRNSPPVAVVSLYNAGAPTPGTSGGNLRNQQISVQATSLAAVPVDLVQGSYSITDFNAQQPITLAPTEALCVNFNGAALPAGAVFGYGFEWTER